MDTIHVKRIEGEFGFEAEDVKGHKARLDTSSETGGSNFGIRPMQMLLMGLGGCSGIDIISILKKQRITPEDFSMTITGHREKDKVPSLWESVHVIFEFTGDIDADKAIRACALSIDKYCSVAETLRRSGTKLTWQTKINGK
ncbi:MAG: OsmC family protein [Ginsengibacter sp.]